MKRGAEKQLTKDHDMDDETEVCFTFALLVLFTDIACRKSNRDKVSEGQTSQR